MAASNIHRLRTVRSTMQSQLQNPQYSTTVPTTSALTATTPTPPPSESTTTNSIPERYHNTVQLPDGRTLAWAEAGSPSGYPLVFLHGFPGSRIEARGLEDIGRRHNIRFICPDRPGYGMSTFQPGRRLLDWPADLHFLARKHLGLERYSVIGGSGGGPHALACAYALPPEELSSVGLMCSAGPWEAGTQGVPLSARLGSWASANCPVLTTQTLDLGLNLAKRFMASNTGKNLLDTMTAKAAASAGKEIPESEKGLEATAARRERVLRILLEPFAQGSRGFVQEAYILTHPYGFRLEDVQNKVQIWHGTKDANSPIRMLRYLSDRLPDCELHELEGETHFTIQKYLEEIVLKVVKDQ